MLPTDRQSKYVPASAKVALNGIFLCVSLILSYIETLIPLNWIVPLPGFKLGLANIAVMIVCVYISSVDAAMVSFLRVLISSVLFGSVTSFLFSFSGAVSAFISLIILKNLKFFKKIKLFEMSWIGVSVICAAAHNIGQILAASAVFASTSVFSYLPWLLVMSVICGIVTGTLMCMLVSSGIFKKYL